MMNNLPLDHFRSNKAESVSEKQLYILELNDHCLLDIFDQLSRNDLNAVASTCCRFQAIARRIFQKTASNLNLEITDKTIEQYGVCKLNRHLQNFGDLIRRIDFERLRLRAEHRVYVENQFSYDAIRRYCGQTLEELHLACIGIPSLSAANGTDGLSHFPNVRNLLLRNCVQVPSPNVLEPANKKYSTNYLRLIASPATLERVSISNCDFNNDLFENLGRYRKLRAITLNECSGDSNYYHLGHLKQLIELNLKGFFPLAQQTDQVDMSKVLMHLGSARSLERLTVKYLRASADEFYTGINRFTNLRELEFSHVDHFHVARFNSLNNFGRIVKFAYHRPQELFPNDVIEMVRNMP